MKSKYSRLEFLKQNIATGLGVALPIGLTSSIYEWSTNPETVEKFAVSIPTFNVDPFWPNPLPNNWLLGQVAGVTVDSQNHIWIVHRPDSLGDDETNIHPREAFPYVPAPPVIQFNVEGEILQSWGGPGDEFDWPETEHGIFVDHKDNIWIGGSGENDHQVLKFSSDGKFLLQIGKAGKTRGSNHTRLLGKPADIEVDPNTDEVYIADGYLNNRIIVFDASTGKYQRHWGAYGNKPDISEFENQQQFGTPVHGVGISTDNLVYVCDRSNNRIQVFEKNGKFVHEQFIAKKTQGLGSIWNLDFSHDLQETFLYVADGTNQCVWILERKNLKKVGKFGQMGRYAGQFIWLHNIAVDSQGNIYTTEVYTGKRVQKFNLLPKSPNSN